MNEKKSREKMKTAGVGRGKRNVASIVRGANLSFLFAPQGKGNLTSNFVANKFDGEAHEKMGRWWGGNEGGKFGRGEKKGKQSFNLKYLALYA